MKLVRYGNAGDERLGLIDGDGSIRDLSSLFPDEHDIHSRIDEISKIDVETLKIVSGNSRLGPCIKNVGKFICVGLNYADHASESNMQLPEEPVLFMKATSAICGPNDDVIIPRGAKKTDWEVELGIIIGKSGSYIDEVDAYDHIAGYCVVNDVSERESQLEGTGQWVKGKSADSFGPIGPWFVTKEEVPDTQNLNIWLEVNGMRLQNSNTRNMVFSVPYLVSYISQFMSLHPGDIIASGTPPGVGLGMDPPRYLQSGDRMRLGIDSLGIQCQEVRSSPEK